MGLLIDSLSPFRNPPVKYSRGAVYCPAVSFGKREPRAVHRVMHRGVGARVREPTCGRAECEALHDPTLVCDAAANFLETLYLFSCDHRENREE